MFSVGKQIVALASLPIATFGTVLSGPIRAAEIPAQAITAAPALSSASTIEAAPIEATPVAAATAAPLAIDGDPAARLVLLLAGAALAWNAQPADAETATAEAAPLAETAAIDPDIECMAKVVHHEARNQSRRGQLAVAQLIMNRIQSGRFPATACAVANQPGQFFSTASYHPRRDSADWANAVEVARAARDGTGDAVAPGALFFQAAYASTNSFFRSRQRVATLGDHIFYR